MTDLRKAAEMALPLLVAYQDYTGDSRIANKCGKAIKALRQALAQPEQEPVAFEDWLKNQHGDPEEIGFLQALRVAYYAGADSHPPPPSKPWVSLTDEEIDYIYKQNHNQYGEDITGEYERELEAKLKVKNT